MSLRLAFGLTFVVGTVSLAACGTESSTFPENSSSSGGNGSSSSGTGIGTSGGSDAGVLEEGQFAKCAEARDAAKRLPLHLVLLLDRSSSMCCYDEQCQRVNGQEPHRDCNNPASRWAVTQSALASFFSSGETEGITLSLLPFPKRPNAPGDLRTQCLADYSEEAVFQERALPFDITGDLDAAKPASAGWVTPTTPAMQGAIEFARELKQSVPAQDTVAILFATDGQPKDCNSTFDPEFTQIDGDIGPASTAAAAAKQSHGIATYVIGLDDPNENLRPNLEQLATAAGTAPPALISLQDPNAAANQLKEALNAVRGKALGCELIVPAAPEGKTLDPKKVNVVFIPSSGESRILPYSDDCADSNGWYYDNPSEPTRITLCAASCTLAQDDPEGRLEVVLGCETQGEPVN